MQLSRYFLRSRIRLRLFLVMSRDMRVLQATSTDAGRYDCPKRKTIYATCVRRVDTSSICSSGCISTHLCARWDRIRLNTTLNKKEPSLSCLPASGGNRKEEKEKDGEISIFRFGAWPHLKFLVRYQVIPAIFGYRPIFQDNPSKLSEHRTSTVRLWNDAISLPSR